jgi:hypothetical protein
VTSTVEQRVRDLVDEAPGALAADGENAESASETEDAGPIDDVSADETTQSVADATQSTDGATQSADAEDHADEENQSSMEEFI